MKIINESGKEVIMGTGERHLSLANLVDSNFSIQCRKAYGDAVSMCLGRGGIKVIHNKCTCTPS